MLKDISPENKHPQIYAYTTPEFKDTNWTYGRKGKGLICIGFTERQDVHQRLKEQFPKINPHINPYELLCAVTAISELGEVFSDKDVHKILEEHGIKKVRGEWYECTIEEVHSAINEIKIGKKFKSARHLSFECRPEQENAIEITKKYFETNPGSLKKPSQFLWNAKMRFGKTFASYKLAERMNWKKILILTYKPASAKQWRADVEHHVDFANWKFFGPREHYEINTTNSTFVLFASFQDILGNRDKKVKERFRIAIEENWDCVFVDEYHFGAWRDTAKEIYAMDKDDTGINALEKIKEGAMPLNVKHNVYLSGTPFRALASGEFTEDQIFNWTYSDEQKAKANYGNSPNNPYSDLPRMILMTYKLPDLIREKALEEETREFDLNEFFRAESITGKNGQMAYVFAYEDEVNMWLNLLRGQISDKLTLSSNVKLDKKVLPFENAAMQTYLAHTFWFLPTIASCHAMKVLLQNNGNFYNNYEIIVAAGNEVGMGEKAIEPVKRAIGSNPLNTRTITLSCGKLIMGVSIPQWTGIFLLRNTSSPETYFQAAFRVQTPWSYKGINNPEEKIIQKDNCYVFDFAPTRALRLISEYSARLNFQDKEGVSEKVEQFIDFLPVLCFDGSTMQSLVASDILDIAIAGVSSSMLARRWRSDRLINLDSFTLQRLLDNPDLINALSKLEAFRNMFNLEDRIVTIVNNEESLRNVRRSREKKTKTLSEEEKQANKLKAEIKEKLKKFLTRIPIFMYLTEHREETLVQVIRNIEPSLFTKVTGLQTEEFEQLCELGLFNSSIMNQSIFAFKRFEDSSLDYVGGGDLGKSIGGFDTVVDRDSIQ